MKAIRQRLVIWVKKPLFWVMCAVVAAVGLAGLYAAWKMGVTPAMLRAQLDLLLDGIRDKPILLWLAIVVLPTFPVPVSPMLLAVGAVFKPLWGAAPAFFYALSATLANMAAMWWLAAYPGHRFAQWLLAKFDVRLPRVEDRAALIPLTVVCRITPGFPLFLQNIILGFLRVPFLPYILISTASSAVFTFGFVVLGGALLEGQMGVALAAVGLILLAMIVMRFLRRKKSREVVGEGLLEPPSPAHPENPPAP